MLVDPLDRVPIELKLADHYGAKVNPIGAQLAESQWLLAGAAQSLKHPQLSGVASAIEQIVA